jgi:hypothetical protein
MIRELKSLLKQVNKEKAEAMKPYNERIRTIKGAIRNLEAFKEVTTAMNEAPDKPVATLPSDDEA